MFSSLLSRGLPSLARAYSTASPLQLVAQRVKAGTAKLIDVREPKEWEESGVAEPATLLSLSSLEARSEKWNAFLKQNKEKDLIFYCKAGGRAGAVANALAGNGYKTENAGGFSSWVEEGLPTRKATEEELMRSK
jgi:rhodanese-related sulfurtransferase